jgi:hypothetical protein
LQQEFETLRDFKIPPGIRPPPGEEISGPWVWSAVMIYLLFITDAFARESPWSRDTRSKYAYGRKTACCKNK